MARAKPGTKAYFRLLREKAAAEGLCRKCRKRKAAKGRITCRHCLDQNYARVKILRAAGKCLHCKQDPMPGFRICRRCSDRGIKKNRVWRLMCKRLGLCCDCGGASPLQRALCAVCGEGRRDRRLMSGRF